MSDIGIRTKFDLEIQKNGAKMDVLGFITKFTLLFREITPVQASFSQTHFRMYPFSLIFRGSKSVAKGGKSAKIGVAKMVT